jgi:hypothetical protein
LRCVRFREARTGVEGEAGEIAGDDILGHPKMSGAVDAPENWIVKLNRG